MTLRLEVCIDTVAGLAACLEGGADRVELCSALELGGLTPSPGLIAAATALPLPVRVMIRPRAGDFRFSEAEVAQMVADIDAVHLAGLSGVVLGAATVDGMLDTAVLRQLVLVADDLGKTLHRVIDTLTDPVAAVDEAITLGFDTILTSGAALRADDGAAVIAAMVERAAGRIDIMVGSGVNAGNAASLRTTTGAPWLHASCSSGEAAPDEVSRFGFGPAERRFTDAGRIRILKAAMAAG